MEFLSHELIAQIGAIVATYGPYALVPLMLVEAPLVTIGAGFLVGAGVMSLPVAILVYSIADLIGTHAYFYVGRGGSAFIESIRTKITTREARSHFLGPFREWAQEGLHRNFVRTYTIGKLLPLPYTTITITVISGALGISYKRFIRLLLVLIPLQGGIFLTIGFLLAQGFLFELTPLRLIGLILVGLVMIGFWISREYLSRRVRAFTASKN
jgi:membrane protein DedA with SNARE-associated domain